MNIKSFIRDLISAIYILCVHQFVHIYSVGVNCQKQYTQEVNERKAVGLKTEVVENETIQIKPKKRCRPEYEADDKNLQHDNKIKINNTS